MRGHIAVDIGASSMRLMLGRTENGRLVLKELHRAENKIVTRNGHMCWDLERLYGEIINGLRACAELGERPESMGIDTWGVDYVLLDENDRPVGDTVAYRDGRTAGMDEELEKSLPYEKHYALTGIAKQSFNTVYQLMAQARENPEEINAARSFLMVPDYLGFLLTGCKRNEYTDASTTGLLNARTRDWDKTVLSAAGIPERLFSRAPAMPGERLGRLKPEICKLVGLELEVLLPAAHDTGSAYVAVPARDNDAVYLSSGTWSLLGVENDEPFTDLESLAAGFTNEGGATGKYRYLKNIMGLWILQRLRKETDERYTFAQMADMALAARAYAGRVDVNDARFLAPESMTDELHAALRENGAPEPKDFGELLACVYYSLAECYRDAVTALSGLVGRRFTSINIVGGGSQNAVLNQWTADATGLPVYAGPAEGTALGNILLQMIASGELSDIAEARALIKRSFDVRAYMPQ